MRFLFLFLLICSIGQAQSNKVIIPDYLLLLDTNPNFSTFTPEAFNNCWASYPNAQLVDVRTAQEYAEGHIADAIHIDVKQDSFLQKANTLLDKNRPVAVYCKGGIRSRQAAKILLEHGFMVYNLQEGYDGWVKALKEKGNEEMKDQK